MQNEYPHTARFFDAIWEDHVYRESILKMFRHEKSRESSHEDIDQILVELYNDPDSPDRFKDIESDLVDIAAIVDFIWTYIGDVPLDPDYVAQNPQLVEGKG